MIKWIKSKQAYLPFLSTVYKGDVDGHYFLKSHTPSAKVERRTFACCRIKSLSLSVNGIKVSSFLE